MPSSAPDAATEHSRANALVEHFFRREYGRILARLLGRYGTTRLELAEEALQESMARAVRLWPIRGIPDEPAAWLSRVASNVVLDRLRREARARRVPDERLAEVLPSGVEGAMPEAGKSPFDDDMLAMIFLCCHPAFSREVRVALTLKSVAGLGTVEIARAFLIPEATVAQRIVRAKRRIRDGDVRLELPEGPALEGRREAVLDVLYLVFNEGYTRFGDEEERAVTAGEDDEIGRRRPYGLDLVEEAIRLADLVAKHPMGRAPQVDALRALLRLQSSRLAARLDETGALVTLAEQDRSRWDRARIEEGLRLLAHSARGGRASSYHLLAGVAACHVTAPSFERTDWPRILSLYDDLLAGSAEDGVLRLNRAVALAEVEGPAVALAEVEVIAADPRAARYPQLPALRAELLARLGRDVEATAAFAQAAEVAPSAAARRALEARAGVSPPSF